MISLIQTTYIMVLFVCLLALIWGSDHERKGALLYMILSGANLFLADTGLFPAMGLLFLTGLTCLAGFVALCWKSPHPWPLWAAAAQGMAIMAHFLRLTNPQITAATTDTIQLMSTYIILTGLLAGTLNAGRYRKLSKG